MKKVRPRCGQPSDRGRLKNRTYTPALLTANWPGFNVGGRATLVVAWPACDVTPTPTSDVALVVPATVHTVTQHRSYSAPIYPTPILVPAYWYLPGVSTCRYVSCVADWYLHFIFENSLTNYSRWTDLDTSNSVRNMLTKHHSISLPGRL